MPVEGITPEQIARTGMTRWYTTQRMFWVDPVTGAPVNGEEIHREELRDARKMGMSEDTVTAFSGHVKMREDYIEDTVELVKSQRVLSSSSPRTCPGDSSASAPDCSRSPVAGGPDAPAARPYDRLSRAVVNRVAGTVAGSSGHGCFG